MQVRANNILTNYTFTGKDKAPVVVLSHSLGSSLAMWERQIESLEPYFQVLRYDTRGHGRSDAPAGAYTLEELGEDAIALLDRLGIDAAHWVGLSMGGMIGQCLALHHAHRLQSLSLCDTASLISEEAQPLWQERINMARDKGMEALVRETLERWFTPPYLSRNTPDIKRIRRHFLATPVAGFVGCSEAIRGLNYLDRLSEITTPTLIIVGEQDPGTPIAAAQAMHERISGSKLTVLPSAAHLSNVEQPEAFNSALMRFLRES